MDKINVLIASRLELHPGYLAEIAAAHPRIAVKDGLPALIADLKRRGVKGVNVERLALEAGPLTGITGDLDTLLADAEVIFGTILFPADLMKRAPKLKWIHIANVGVDRFLSGELFAGNWTITNSRGALATPIAEHVLTFMLMLAQNASRLMENQAQRRWERYSTLELQNRTVGIIGMGAIGREISRVTKGIGMRVIATRRSAARREAGEDGVDLVYPVKDLPAMLQDCDFLVIAAPLTPETRHMISDREFTAMKPSAFIINIGRGPIIDEAALIRALKAKRIAGAGLDVFETEPLPPESELWSMPDVFVSPHMAGVSDRRSHRLIKLFCDNLRLYADGKPLMNVVTKDMPY
jgi:D-2-hydroxyacid dehydrogenase (NADP+)